MWHGSRPENWHAILRTGLRNASGTSLQLHGAAHGAGIYLATDANTSLGYSNMGALSNMGAAGAAAAAGVAAGGSGDNAFLAGKDLRMLALCEVADVPTLRKTGSIWVAPEEAAVVTRFLFAFPNGLAHGAFPQTLDDAFQTAVRACIDSLQKRG